MELRNSGKEAEEGMDEISSRNPCCIDWPDSYFASLVENFLIAFICLPGRHFLSSCRNGCEATTGLAIPYFPLASLLPTENNEEPLYFNHWEVRP
jgi:hypothetical protein